MGWVRQFFTTQVDLDERNMNSETFGCAQCWPKSANRAWEAFHFLIIEARLVDESHFTVYIRACPQCRQRFVSVFTETIDWIEGEDPQSWSILPITEVEFKRLSQDGLALPSTLNQLAPHRRSLRGDFPKGEHLRAYWSSGVFVALHD